MIIIAAEAPKVSLKLDKPIYKDISDRPIINRAEVTIAPTATSLKRILASGNTLNI